MKLTYKVQTIVSVIIIILANIITEIFDFWIYRSIGFAICGFLWIFHPVLPNGSDVSKKPLSWVRLAGVFLVFIGVFTRVHY